MEDKIYNLELDKKELMEELKQGETFFAFKTGLTYKVTLLTPEVKPVEIKYKEEDGSEVVNTKYEIQIKCKCSDGSYYEGSCLVPKSILRPIVDSYEDQAVYNIAKTGSGIETRYSINKDF